MRPLFRGLLKRCVGSGLVSPGPVRRRNPKITPQGKHVHLGDVFERINREWFDGKVSAAITWGRRSGRTPRRSIRLGSYRREQNLIRVHPALDADFVPPYVVEAIVHHEMLHAVIPVRAGENGRRVVHGRDFRAREKRFHGYDRAKKWCREHISRLL